MNVSQHHAFLYLLGSGIAQGGIFHAATVEPVARAAIEGVRQLTSLGTVSATDATELLATIPPKWRTNPADASVRPDIDKLRAIAGEVFCLDVLELEPVAKAVAA